MFGSCKIFSSIWLYSKKCFGKYFLVFGCVAENNIENTFSSCSSHFLSFQTKPNQKKINQWRDLSERKPFCRSGGFDEWVHWSGGFVGAVRVDSLAI